MRDPEAPAGRAAPRDRPAGDWRDRLAARLGRAGAGSAAALALEAACPGCRQRDETAVRALEILQAHSAGPDLLTAPHASPGLCLPHPRQALGALREPALRTLLERQRQAWEDLRAELAELIRKNDYRFRDERPGVEADAWARAVRATAGEPGVF